MARVTTDNQHYSDIADAIRAKGVSGTFYPSEMATAISNIPSGSPGIPESGVVFIDYDGTVVTAWDASEVAGKTALPANPTGHTRLVAEGWNWTLADIKSYMVSYPNAIMTVGQMYHTASGKTELDITVTKHTGLTVKCNISGTKDWGDGTTDSTSSHTYTDYGNYTIKCSGTSISSNIFGTSSSSVNKYWCTAAFIGSGVSYIGTAAFRDCYSLTSVTLHSGVTSFYSTAFRACHSLISVTIPDGTTKILDEAFYACYSLVAVAISNSVTTISNGAFAVCYTLTSLTIPSGVTTIYITTFGSCFCVIKYDFSSATAVPTLQDTSAFNSINGICKIIVPDALYNSWKAATNWVTYADYIYKASEVTD